MSGLQNVIEAARSTTWAILPEKLAVIAEVLAFHAQGGTWTAEQIQARIGDTKKREPMQGAGVAVLPLYGVIGHRMNQMDAMSGGTSTEQFGAWFKAAMADPAIGSIVIDVDSPGGSTMGVRELCESIHAARGQKPIIAIANGMAASAAYWIASSADEFWATPSAEVGSIGVFTIHRDLSAALADAGIKNTVIKAGKYKAEGMPFDPLSDEAREALQARVDEEYHAFVSAVALHRGVEIDDVINGYGEGRALSATKAKRAGMIDKIGTMDTLLGKIGATGTRGKLRAEELTPVIHATHDTAIPAVVAEVTPSVGAAAPVVLLPPESAEQAKEQAMSETGTVATAVADEKGRISALTALARAEKDVVTTEMLSAWIADGTTEAEANKAVLATFKANRAAPIAPTVRPLDGGDNGTKAGPFNSFGEQLMAIRNFREGTPEAAKLHRVNEIYGAATGASAGVGPDGGFLIQKDYATDLVKDGKAEAVLASRCSTTEIGAGSDGLEVTYIDETSRATGSRWGGVQVYRAAEADTVTASKPKLGKWELRLEDIRGLFYATSRLERDASALAQVVSEAFRDEFAFTIDDEIFRGNGVGRCKGVLEAGNLVTVSKETGQLADTIVAENVLNMYARMSPRSRARAAWFVNAACELQLQQMMIGTGTSGQLVYMPPGGLSGAPYGSLLGRPVIAIEHASALGDLGDIAFLDLSRYKLITKGGIQEDQSPHVRFIYWENTWRWSVSINGAPMDKLAITPYKGADTLSPFVTLAARA